jgi:hypothetical protein
MTQDDYNLAYSIGYDAAREVWGRLAELSPNRDDEYGFVGRVLPDAMASALVALPFEDEEPIDDAVVAGVRAYWRAARIAR